MKFRGPFASHDSNPHPNLRERQVGDGMGGGRNGRFYWGTPILHLFVEKWCILKFPGVLAKNRGAAKTGVPTTTHPIPHLTPASELQLKKCLARKFSGNFGGMFPDPQNKGSEISGKISEHFS